MARPTIEPVTDALLPDFAEFLHRHLDPRHAPEAFRRGLQPDWPDQPPMPNHGFVLREAGAIVGGIGAIYGERTLADGQRLRSCNITGWCVLDSHRQQSMRLAMAITSQPGWHFTDFSPTQVVSGTLQFLKFKPLDERRVAALNLPHLGGPFRVEHDPARIEALLPPSAAVAYRDHRAFPWLRHLALGDGQRWCHVIYKARRFKHLPAADLLHLGDPALVRAGWRTLSAHLLSRGFASTHGDLRLLGDVPGPKRLRSGFNRKVFLSDVWQPETVDCLYAESLTMDL